MGIKNFLKGKYWLWGLLFGIILVEPIGSLIYFLLIFSQRSWENFFGYFQRTISFSPIVLVFFIIISELFFRIINKFKKISPNSFLRILLLFSLVLLTLISIALMLAAVVIPSAY